MDRYCPPPKRFKPAGQVSRARFSHNPPPFLSIPTRRGTGAKAEGKRYEEKALGYLQYEFGDWFIPSPWLQFWNELGEQWCQPDALVVDFRASRIIIAEVKLRHTSDAWWQLVRKYVQVVDAIFPAELWRLCCVEIVRWYDPQIAFPVRPILRKSLRDLRADKLNVHTYNDRYARLSRT